MGFLNVFLGWLGITTLFALIFLFIWLSIKLMWLDAKSLGEYILSCFVTIMMFIGSIFIFILLTLFVSIWHTHSPEYTKNIYGKNMYIYSIGINNSVEGNFTLGCGSVNGITTYRFFTKENGGYKCYEVDASKTTIIETDNCKPHIQYIIGKTCTCEANWFMKAYFGDNENFWRDEITGTEQIIYIPKGSVVQTYEIRP